jgi:hypothetical protein
MNDFGLSDTNYAAEILSEGTVFGSNFEDTVFKPLVLFLSLEQNNLGYILDKFV